MELSVLSLTAILYVLSLPCRARGEMLDIKFDKAVYETMEKSVVVTVIGNLSSTVTVFITSEGFGSQLRAEPEYLSLSPPNFTNSFNLSLPSSPPHTISFTIFLRLLDEEGSGTGDTEILTPANDTELDMAEVIFRTETITSSVMSSTPIMVFSSMFPSVMSSEVQLPMMSSVMTSSVFPTTAPSSPEIASPSPSLVGVVSSPVVMATTAVSTATISPVVSPPPVPLVSTVSLSSTTSSTSTMTSSTSTQMTPEPLGVSSLPVATTPTSSPPASSPIATEPHPPTTDSTSPSLSRSLTPSPPTTTSDRSSDDGIITAISIVIFLILLIVAIAVVAVVIALLLARKKRRTHTYYTAGVSGNKFNHYIDVQVRTDEEMREKTPDSKDLPIFETSFVGKGSTTVLNEPHGTTLTFKGELAAALKARTQKIDPVVPNGNGSHPKEREE